MYVSVCVCVYVHVHVCLRMCESHVCVCVWGNGVHLCARVRLGAHVLACTRGCARCARVCSACACVRVSEALSHENLWHMRNHNPFGCPCRDACCRNPTHGFERSFLT